MRMPDISLEARPGSWRFPAGGFRQVGQVNHRGIFRWGTWGEPRGNVGVRGSPNTTGVFCFGCGREGNLGNLMAGFAAPLYYFFALSLYVPYTHDFFFLLARERNKVPQVPQVPRILVSNWIYWIERRGTLGGEVPLQVPKVPLQQVEEIRVAVGSPA